MSTNRELADQFERMAAVLELLGANRFRVASYERGARALRDMSRDVAEWADEPKKLTEIEGIGKGLAEKIGEYVRTGRVEEVEETLKRVPAGVLDVMEVPGLGPKTAGLLWEKAGVESIDDLKAKLASGELEGLPRLGKKTIENIQKSLAFMEQSGRRSRIGDAMVVAERIVEAMQQVTGVSRVDYAGSLRRGKETIGDVDILAACHDPAKHGDKIGQAFRELPDVQQVIAAGETKSSVRIEGGLQVDLRVIRADRYGAALMYFTGSKDHNVRMRERSIKRNLKLNEYGLWKEGDDPSDPDARPVAAKTEQAVFSKLDLAWVPPEMREDRGEFELAERDAIPELIETSRIQAELHAHTVASDGAWTIEEYAEEARRRGYTTIAVTDHSPAQTIANGLEPSRLEKHIDEVRKANKKITGITILAGSEVDIRGNGALDYDDDLLAELDIVVASPHVALTQEPQRATKRLLAALENPHVHILGHPTGRIINKREGLNPDMQAVIEKAVETHTALEINANHQRLDLRDTHARAALEAGAMLSINTDAHGVDHLDMLRYGVLTARRAWAEPGSVINTFTPQKLRSWLKQKRKHMGAAH